MIENMDKVILSKKCEYCGRVFEKNQSTSLKSWNNITRFCSRDCAYRSPSRSQKIVMANRKRVVSKETREKMSQGRRGKKMSDEFCKKISERNKRLHILPPNLAGTHWSIERRAKMIPIILKNSKNPEIRKRISEGKARKKGWITRLPGYRAFMEKQREIRKQKNGGSHAFSEWKNLKKQCNFTCQMCGKREPEIKLTQDHIIPLIKGGDNSIKNIQPLCSICNSKKGVKIIAFSMS